MRLPGTSNHCAASRHPAALPAESSNAHKRAVRSRVTLKLLHWLFPPPSRQRVCPETAGITLEQLAAGAAYGKKGVSKRVDTRPKAGRGMAGLHMAVDLLGLPVSAEQAPQNSHPPHPGHLLGHTSIGRTLSFT